PTNLLDGHGINNVAAGKFRNLHDYSVMRLRFFLDQQPSQVAAENFTIRGSAVSLEIFAEF
ncbi:hypothetical protein ACPXAU_23700, partial [Salmonella enterica]|uniref:hypothetical protein n=1 Tax=Salmonella enterica TaxID=28901 RepID=UPI003CED0225